MVCTTICHLLTLYCTLQLETGRKRAPERLHLSLRIQRVIFKKRRICFENHSHCFAETMRGQQEVKCIILMQEKRSGCDLHNEGVLLTIDPDQIYFRESAHNEQK